MNIHDRYLKLLSLEQILLCSLMDDFNFRKENLKVFQFLIEEFVRKIRSSIYCQIDRTFHFRLKMFCSDFNARLSYHGIFKKISFDIKNDELKFFVDQSNFNTNSGYNKFSKEIYSKYIL